MNDNLWYHAKDGKQYFEQRKNSISESVQKTRSLLFLGMTCNDDKVLDFGCGTGGILASLPAKERVGIEVGEDASAAAKSKGIKIFKNLNELDSSSCDVAISFHALEHVDVPLTVLVDLWRVLKPGGRIRIAVPCEIPLFSASRRWSQNRDRHLYTWTPLLIGNLAFRAGFENIDARLEPMPSGSRFSKVVRGNKGFSRWLKLGHSLWYDRLNTVIDAIKPANI